MSTDKPKVLVTGGTGFIGLHLVQQLLNDGYIVNITSRLLDPTKNEAIFYLQSKFINQLFVYKADVTQPGSCAEAIAGTEAVFHLASPKIIKEELKDPYQQLVNPEIEGVKNILESCELTSSVKAVIINSSAKAIYSSLKLLPIHTESNFNYVDTLTTCPYSVAKVKAEEILWEFEKSHSDKLRIVSINPPLVFGPVAYPKKFSLDRIPNNPGLHIIKDYLVGSLEKISQGGISCIDVRDVAQCHLKALQNPQASGRFVVVGSKIQWTRLAEILRALAPKNKIPSELDGVFDQSQNAPVLNSRKAMQKLVLEYRLIEDTIKDTLAQIEELQ